MHPVQAIGQALGHKPWTYMHGVFKRHSECIKELESLRGSHIVDPKQWKYVHLAHLRVLSQIQNYLTKREFIHSNPEDGRYDPDKEIFFSQSLAVVSREMRDIEKKLGDLGHRIDYSTDLQVRSFASST